MTYTWDAIDTRLVEDPSIRGPEGPSIAEWYTGRLYTSSIQHDARFQKVLKHVGQGYCAPARAALREPAGGNVAHSIALTHLPR
jgi:hypothetical protein